MKKLIDICNGNRVFHAIFNHPILLIILFVAVVCVSFGNNVLKVHAQDRSQDIGLSISPPLIEMLIKPGKSVVIAYTVSNLGSPQILTSYIRPFKPLGSQGGLLIEKEFSGPIRFNLENSNIALDKPFKLNADEGQQLVLKIRVPEGTPEGDYYYTFLATTQEKIVKEGSVNAQNSASIGSNILITVSNTGSKEIQGTIGKFHVQPHWQFSLFGTKYLLFESTDIIPVELIVNNTGHNLISPTGKIKLQGGLGHQSEYTILQQNILAESSRKLLATPSAELTSPDQSFVINGFFIGKYYLTSDISLGANSNNLTSVEIFYALPFKLIIAIIIGITTAIILIVKFRKNESDSVETDA